MEYLSEIIGVVCGGGIGALIMQLYTAKVSKQKVEIENAGAILENKHKSISIQNDAYEQAYTQLSKCLKDYQNLSEEFNNYMQQTRKFEIEVQNTIREKCTEIAALKSKITYLSGLRCYKSDCSCRIKDNPDHEEREHHTTNNE